MITIFEFISKFVFSVSFWVWIFSLLIFLLIHFLNQNIQFFLKVYFSRYCLFSYFFWKGTKSMSILLCWFETSKPSPPTNTLFLFSSQNFLFIFYNTTFCVLILYILYIFWYWSFIFHVNLCLIISVFLFHAIWTLRFFYLKINYGIIFYIFFHFNLLLSINLSRKVGQFECLACFLYCIHFYVIQARYKGALSDWLM